MVGVIMSRSTPYGRPPGRADEMPRLWFERVQPLTFARGKCRESAAVMISVTEESIGRRGRLNMTVARLRRE